MLASYKKSLCAVFVVALYCVMGLAANAQSAGNSSSVSGMVLDPSGAVVPNAAVELQNPVSAFDRTTATDSAGRFTIPNVPFNPYHLTVTGQGFAPIPRMWTSDLSFRSQLRSAYRWRARVKR